MTGIRHNSRDTAAIERTCRSCGCTEHRACVSDTENGQVACHWVERDLCSACSVEGDGDNSTYLEEHLT